MTTYVFENVEVKKTGRTAQRKLSSGNNDQLVEITPVNDRDGVWHKWVPEKSLYIVQENKNDNDA